MRANTFLSIVITLLATACGGGSADQRDLTLQGQILSVSADHREALIKHEEIKGFMPAMTMSYKVRDPKEFEPLAPGDLVNATLVVVSNDAYLKNVKKVGQAPLEKLSADSGPPPVSQALRVLKDGEPVPHATFIDQDGKTRDIRSFSGSAVVITFIYTNCPMPTFCPLMDRHFATMQEKLKADPALNVRLVSVSFDPLTDTPPVLKQHAKELGADPKIWSFFTGDEDEINRFASQFGVMVTRAPNDQRNITHNLRTALLDRQGNLVKTYTGNEWTPEQVVADIKVLVGVD